MLSVPLATVEVRVATSERLGKRKYFYHGEFG